MTVGHRMSPLDGGRKGKIVIRWRRYTKSKKIKRDVHFLSIIVIGIIIKKN